MGRSQVQRNKTHGRPGQGGRGRGREGRGRGKPHQKQDLSKLGDNSFRFNNNSNDVGDDYDGLLDEINISAYALSETDNLLSDTGGNQESDSSDYLSIDFSSLSKCLEQLPIAERLNLPLHVGKHLKEMYGGVRKKTLAELREDSKIQHGASGNSQRTKGDTVDVMKNGSKSQTKEFATAEETVVEDDEQDFEAWLDDMIS